MQVAKDFVTPDRAGPSSSIKRSLSDADGQSITSDGQRPTSTSRSTAHHNAVTPLESSSRSMIEPQSPVTISIDRRIESPLENCHEKHVRFGNGGTAGGGNATNGGEREIVTPTGSNTGLRRTKLGSARPADDATADSSSPSAPGGASGQRGLVSRRGGRAASPVRPSAKVSLPEQPVLEYRTFRSPPRKRGEDTPAPASSSATSGSAGASSVDQNDKGQQAAPSADAGREAENGRPREDSSVAANKNSKQSKRDDTETVPDNAEPDEPAQRPKMPLNASPPPLSRENIMERLTPPARSPTGDFQNLPSLDDALRSPVSLFLSPHPLSPRNPFSERSRHRDDGDDETSKPDMMSPRTRDREREQFVATPTDFAADFGKGHPNSGPFDSSNVLAWLQSPTANGLFSPGGFGSILNTPRAISASAPLESRTPGTPNISTSFFFSDVAGLPRSTDFISPKTVEGSRRGLQRGYSNIISISPLASSKNRNGGSQSTNTPINFKDVFASPNEKSRSRHLAAIADGEREAQRIEGRDPSLDSVHMAELDILEDKGLSVLMQLASSTPRSIGGSRLASVSNSGGSDVFRPPSIVKSGGSPDENLPGLQLPAIGGESDGHSARLSRKTHSRDHDDDGNFSNGTKKSTASKASKSSKSDRKGGPSSSNGSMRAGPAGHHLYPMPPPYPPHPGADVSYYAHLPPGMPPNGGMRAMGGGIPPPPRPSKTSSGHVPRPGSPRTNSRPYPVGIGDAPFPPYPPPGHFHPGVPPPHVGGIPPYHYPPHPSHRHSMPPMYCGQPPHAPPPHTKSKPSKKKSTTKAAKRPLEVSSNSAIKTANNNKKSKGNPAPNPPKKKNKSPQLTDKTERQRAAATIQAVNVASGGKNDRAAALAAAILRGVTMRPSGKWQAQLYFAGKSRYIGVFDSREKAALAYEIAREKLKTEKVVADNEGGLTPKATDAAVNAARKAAFEGVNEHVAS